MYVINAFLLLIFESGIMTRIILKLDDDLYIEPAIN